MSRPRPPPDGTEPEGKHDPSQDDQRPGSSLDTLETRKKLSGRRRPPPRRGLEAIVDKSAERQPALVVGALPAHVEVIFEKDAPTAFTNADVHIVRVHPALIAALGSPVVVGDRVTVATLPNGQLYAIDADPRRTLIARPAIAREKTPQPLVANADTLWIVVAAANPSLRPAMVDRFLVTAAAGGLTPRIVATKADLDTDDESRGWLEFYERIGIPVIRTSINSLLGLDLLRAQLTTGLSVLLGQSGVGKSSLVRAILPERPIAVGEVSEATGKGRHTTTVTRYYRLPEGGAVIDTPGLRELGLWGAEISHLDVAFPDIADLAATCRFANCRHEQEPGCAVRDSDLAPVRLASFRKLAEEIHQRLRPGFGKPGGPEMPR